MSNSQLPLLIFDPQDVAKFEGEIVEEVKGYTAGVSYTSRSGSGIQQLSDFNSKYVIATQRTPSGMLSMISLSMSFLARHSCLERIRVHWFTVSRASLTASSI